MLVRELFELDRWKRWIRREIREMWVVALFAWMFTPSGVPWWHSLVFVWGPAIVAMGYWEVCSRIEEKALGLRRVKIV